MDETTRLLVQILLLTSTPCAAVLLIGVGLVLWRRYHMHGYQSEIQLDGASLLKANDGSLVVRPRSLFNLLAIALLSLVVLGLVAWAASTIFAALSGADTVGNAVEITLLALGLGLMLVVAIISSARALFTPAIHLNAGTRLLQLGRGKTARQIPFAKLAHVVADAGPATSVSNQVTSVALQLITTDAETIVLGTLSGEDSEVRGRAESIAESVAQLTGAQLG